MRNKHLLCAALFLAVGLCLALKLDTKKAEAASFATEAWQPIEITLTSSKAYTNRYVDVDVSATFYGPGGVAMTMPGFWDGGDTWKIRFAPPSTGTWTYTTESTDTTNTGLHNQTGTISVTAYSGSLDIYKHGFLKRSANNRYLTYYDGTPFFWLADTHWMGLSSREKLSSSSDPRWSSMFKGMADERAKQGYSVYQMNLFASEMGDLSVHGTSNEGGHPWQFSGYTVSASSNYSRTSTTTTNGFAYYPRKATDGNVNTYWRPDPNAALPQYLIIDLGAPTAVSKVETLFASYDSSWKYTIQASMEQGIGYTTIADHTSGTAGQSITDTVSITARYVRINLLGSAGSVPAVSEFKVFDAANQYLSNFGVLHVLNPGFWQNVDERIQYLSAKGFVVSLGLEWGSAIDPNNYSDFERLARYVLARYGAYPTVWTAASEFIQGDAGQWGAIAKYFKDHDPYARVSTLHSTGDNPLLFRDQSWFDVDFIQTGHGDSAMKGGSWWNQRYDQTPTKPVLEGENQYENLTRITPDMTRHAAWMSFMGGSFGYSYGAEGIWNATTDQADTWQAWGGYQVPWYRAIHAEAGQQMVYYKDFLTQIDWSALEPNASIITWSGAPSGTYAPYQKAKADKSVVIAYLPKSTSTYTGTLNGLSTGDTYSAYWLNPIDGKYTPISASFTPGAGGSWSVPAKPDGNDWVLWVQQTTNAVAMPAASIDSGEYDTSPTVSLTTSTAGAAIYYTTDGTLPTAASTLYTGPLSLPSSATLRAIAIKSGSADSMIMTKYYRIGAAKPVSSVGTRLIDNSYYSAIQVQLSTATAGAAIYYTTNGTLPTTSSTLYTGAITIASSATLRAIAVKSGSPDSEMLVEDYIIKTPTAENIALGRDYTRYNASSSYDAAQTAEKAFDANASGWTDWQAAPTLFSGQWLEVDFGYYTPVNRVKLLEYGARTTGFRIEAWDGANWNTVYTGTSIPAGYIQFPTVDAVKLRVYFTSGSLQPIIYEFEAYFDANLALNKAYQSSSIYSAGETANKAFDNNGATDWQAAPNQFNGEWLEVDLGASTTFNEVFLSEYGGRTTGYRIEYWNGTTWQTAYTGTTLAYTKTVSFPAVTGSKARIYFTSGSLQPIIYEFRVMKRP